MVFGVDDALIAAAIQAAASIGGGYLAGQGNKESKLQKTKRNTIDQLLDSINGNGPYSDLYNFDQDTFNKSFVEPAQAKFRNQIAPQIQQQYIASGQQRGTGLDDQLLRAGVDLDSEINRYMYQAQQDALNRQQLGINSVLGAGDGAPPEQSGWQNLAQSTSGYLSSPAFAQTVKDVTGSGGSGGYSTAPPMAPNTYNQRAGYKPDFLNYNLNDPRWGY